MVCPIPVDEWEERLYTDLVLLAAGIKRGSRLGTTCLPHQVVLGTHSAGNSFAQAIIAEAAKAGHATTSLLRGDGCGVGAPTLHNGPFYPTEGYKATFCSEWTYADEMFCDLGCGSHAAAWPFSQLKHVGLTTQEHKMSLMLDRIATVFSSLEFR